MFFNELVPEENKTVGSSSSAQQQQKNYKRGGISNNAAGTNKKCEIINDALICIQKWSLACAQLVLFVCELANRRLYKLKKTTFRPSYNRQFVRIYLHTIVSVKVASITSNNNSSSQCYRNYYGIKRIRI